MSEMVWEEGGQFDSNLDPLNPYLEFFCLLYQQRLNCIVSFQEQCMAVGH